MSAPAPAFTAYRYPVSDVAWGNDESLAAIGCLTAQQTTMGARVAAFEQLFSEKLTNGRPCVMVNSGSSADLLLAFADKQQAGLRKHTPIVLLPAVTWPTQVWSWVLAGFNVQLVDVDARTFNVDYAALEEEIRRYRGLPAKIVLGMVHLMGNPLNMTRLRGIADQYHAWLYEDCCEALGAKWLNQPVGTFGDGAAFSFFHSHHISTMEGGMVVAPSEGEADQYKQMRSHGWAKGSRQSGACAWDERYQFVNIGLNLRPTELNAAFGIHQLKRFDEMQARRAGRFYHWQTMLRDFQEWIEMPQADERATPSWFAVPMLVTEKAPFTRKQFVDALEQMGIETRPVMSGNFARQPVMQGRRDIQAVGDLPGANRIHDHGLYIGLHSGPLSDTDWAIESVRTWLKAR